MDSIDSDILKRDLELAGLNEKQVAHLMSRIRNTVQSAIYRKEREMGAQS